MKMTMTDGTVFEGSMAEYAELLAFAKAQQAGETPKASDTIVFKLGDKVRMLTDSIYGKPFKGKTGVVVAEADEDGEISVKPVGASASGLFKPENLELLAETDVTIEFEGEQYRKVNRKAQAGDVFVIKHNDGRLPEWFTVGKKYKAYESGGDVMVIADDSDDLSVYSDRFGRTTETIDVYEQAKRKPGEFKEGDIVKYGNGKYGKVREVGGLLLGVVPSDGEYDAPTKSEVELVAPVESLV